MNTKIARNIAGLTVLAALAGGATMAQAEQVWARVVSATPVTESNGQTSYHVTYEYNGQRYSTRTDARPGSTIPVDVGDYGVATTSPVAPQSQLNQGPGGGIGQPDWNNVVPEQGVVVGTGQPAYAAPPPVYAQPAPVYYPAPVYVQPAYGYGYGYGYPGAYAYPPVGLSLNLGYSRGWRGGGGRWR
jgi:hypothetical protein